MMPQCSFRITAVHASCRISGWRMVAEWDLAFLHPPKLMLWFGPPNWAFAAHSRSELGRVAAERNFTADADNGCSELAFSQGG